MYAPVLAGVVVGDIIAAAVHWFEDTYLPSNTQGVLGSIARDNELHHFLPFAITTGSWLSNVSVTMPATAVFVALLWVSGVRDPRFLVPLAVTLGISNLVHRWIHERPCTRPRAVMILQDLGILVSSETHARHHDVGHGDYGIMLNANGAYNAIWPVLETLIGPPTDRKLGVKAYDEFRDAWLIHNMKSACPGKIPEERLVRYKQMLDARTHDRA